MKEKLLWTFESGDTVNCVDISSNGKHILIGSNDNRTSLFDISSNIPLWTYEAKGSITAVALSSNGNYIAIGSEDDQVYMFHWTLTIETEDDDDDLDIDFGESTISFGNYFLVFIFIMIASLAIIYRRKLVFKLKN